MGITETTLKASHGQLGKVKKDIETRNVNTGEEFAMTVAGRAYKGKESREAAAKALNEAILLGRNDPTMRTRSATSPGFDITTRGEADNSVSTFLRGEAVYTIHYNPDNPQVLN